MKKIALIHTVKSVLNSFEDQLRRAMPDEDLKIHNLLDDFLATDPSPEEKAYFTIENKKRLYNDLSSAELTGADVIVVTCSTLTPAVMEIKPFIKVPVIAIDEAMAKAAVASGNRIKVLATAESTLKPSQLCLEAQAEKLGRRIFLDLEAVEPAYRAMRGGDMQLHDRLVKQAAAEIQGFDTIVLAQASMAHLEKEIHAICGCPVYSSIDLCIASVRAVLKNKEIQSI